MRIKYTTIKMRQNDALPIATTTLLGRKEARTNQDMITYSPNDKRGRGRGRPVTRIGEVGRSGKT